MVFSNIWCKHVIIKLCKFFCLAQLFLNLNHHLLVLRNRSSHLKCHILGKGSKPPTKLIIQNYNICHLLPKLRIPLPLLLVEEPPQVDPLPLPGPPCAYSPWGHTIGTLKITHRKDWKYIYRHFNVASTSLKQICGNFLCHSSHCHQLLHLFKDVAMSGWDVGGDSTGSGQGSLEVTHF